MARAHCSNCGCPAVRCVCKFIVATNNDVELIVLQHPKEVNHPKGSGALLINSLVACRHFIGENFDEQIDFQHYLAQLKQSLNTVYVMFPSEHSTLISEVIASPKQNGQNNIALIVLDGTWKKAYKMYQLSTSLHAYPQVHLPDNFISLYQIRKTKKANALSTLEASCHALGVLENNVERYQGLLKSFTHFNHYQLSFRQSEK